jgi:hypothetical protein
MRNYLLKDTLYEKKQRITLVISFILEGLLESFPQLIIQLLNNL